MNYRTLADMAQVIRKNLHLIPRLPVVGIPRSGMIAASMIATMRHLPLSSVMDPLPLEFLLVDDSISGGETLKKYMPLPTAAKVTTLAVYRKPSSPPVDISFETIPGPRVWEWNWAKHAHLKSAVLDIDGVICDETERITDWKDYAGITAIRERCQLLHKPARKVLAIATGRKEHERAQTVDWLARHGIAYQHIFFSTPDRGARQTKLHAIQQTGAHWVVESNPVQAAWLRDRAQVPVLCTDLNQML